MYRVLQKHLTDCRYLSWHIRVLQEYQTDYRYLSQHMPRASETPDRLQVFKLAYTRASGIPDRLQIFKFLPFICDGSRCRTAAKESVVLYEMFCLLLQLLWVCKSRHFYPVTLF